MTLDRSTQEFLAKVAAAATKPRHLMTPEEARAAFAGLRGLAAGGRPSAVASRAAMSASR
jgi:acetyl esterase